MKLDFKNWLINEVRYKGLYRMWKQQNPNMPNYVGHDLYTHNASYAMKNALNNPDDPSNNPSGNYKRYKRTNYSPIPSNSPDRILDNDRAKEIKSINWSKHPQIITVSPANFEQSTLDLMKYRNFGFKSMEQIPRDSERTEIQNKLAKNDGTNEPILLLKTPRGYKLIEGWHRTMNILLKGAPEDQLQMIKQSNYSKVNFEKWNPIKINAYIGLKNLDQYEKPMVSDKNQLTPFNTSQTIPFIQNQQQQV